MSHLLEIEGLTKSFGGITAVRNLSMFVDDGETLGLIGPNGAGKTTVFNLISGIYAPDAGTIKFGGKKISGLRPHKILRMGISRTFQIARPFPRMSVIENIMAGALFGKGFGLSAYKAREKAIELLSYASLENSGNKPAGLLTIAEQRRLELARALATDPKILMLDETLAGLNNAELSALVRLLEKFKRERGITLIVTEHVMKAIVQLCSRIVVMDQGEKLAEGSPSEIMRTESVIEAYMGQKRTI